MKKLILFLALIGVTAMNSATAQTILAQGECGAQGDNLTWVLTSDSVLTISGTGNMVDYDWITYAPWFSNRSQIQKIIVGDNVTSVGNMAFFDSYNLISVNISDELTIIGDAAFAVCFNLVSLIMGDNVTTVGNAAFLRCNNLTSITVKAVNPPALGINAFDNVSDSASVCVPDGAISVYQEVEGWNYFTNYQTCGVGITEPPTGKFMIFPNPTMGLLNIVCESPMQCVTMADYAIYDRMGKIVMQGTLWEDPFVINVESLPVSVYIMVLAGQKMMFVKL